MYGAEAPSISKHLEQERNLAITLVRFVSFIPYFRLLVFGILVTLVAFRFFRLAAHLALQNVNKYYVIFSYFRHFVAKSDQKPKKEKKERKTYV